MKKDLMQAVLIQEPAVRGEWNRLTLGEVPRPPMKEGEVLVQVEACSVNRADLLQRRGLYPPPPGSTEILGLDFAGFVVQKSDNVEGWEITDRVFGIVAGGGYGRYVAVPASHLVRIPENLSFVEAAAAAEVFFTAFYNVCLLGGLQPQETLLVHGGGSGVGTSAIQLAKVMNASVITTAGSAEKVKRCLQLGADHAVNYREEDFAARVTALTDGRGVDVILDWIGAPYLSRHIELLRPRGRLILIGLMGGAQGEIPLAPVLTKRLRILGSVLRSQSLEEKAAITRAFQEQVLPLFQEKKIHPVVDRVFPMAEVEEAHAYLREGKQFGKVVLSWQESVAA